MRSLKSSQVKPRAAVIGAGLAGLSAAYHLHDTARVTIFEKEGRIGGRILTAQSPRGEHGAHFFLSRKNEPTIHKLIKELGLPLISWNKDWPGYVFRGRFVCGSPVQAARTLLPPASRSRVRQLFERVKKETCGNPRGKLDQWLSDFLEKDGEGIAFVEMLLAGETCAPANHVMATYGLGCLSSMYDDWYSIRGGSAKLVESLCERSGARIVLNANVSKVKEIRRGVRVTWTEGDKRRFGQFSAAIIATPDGERLVGKPMRRHFHSYLSVLLGYERPPRLRVNPDFDLSRGLYTDGPLNYIQAAHRRDSYVLRILIPNAETMLRWKERDLVDYCVGRLRTLLAGADRFSNRPVVKKWKFGLPCCGNKKRSVSQRVCQRVFLAGDWLGKWPSMDAAISSGMKATKVL